MVFVFWFYLGYASYGLASPYAHAVAPAYAHAVAPAYAHAVAPAYAGLRPALLPRPAVATAAVPAGLLGIKYFSIQWNRLA